MKYPALNWSVIHGVAATLAAILCVAGSPPEGLIERLGSESYPDRVLGGIELRKWAAEGGEDARKWLLKSAFESKEPEVRVRCMAALKGVVLDELLEERPGFVGVNMVAVKLAGEAGFGVLIRLVSPDSPAEEAGLQVNDVVTKLDGEAWQGGLQAQDEFAKKVGSKRSGTKVKLEVLRDNSTKEIELVLRARPWSAGNYGEYPTMRNADEIKEEAFRKWLRAQAEVEEGR